jgi:hypothetical protein
MKLEIRSDLCRSFDITVDGARYVLARKGDGTGWHLSHDGRESWVADSKTAWTTTLFRAVSYLRKRERFEPGEV